MNKGRRGKGGAGARGRGEERENLSRRVMPRCCWTWAWKEGEAALGRIDPNRRRNIFGPGRRRGRRGGRGTEGAVGIKRTAEAEEQSSTENLN